MYVVSYTLIMYIHNCVYACKGYCYSRYTYYGIIVKGATAMHTHNAYLSTCLHKLHNYDYAIICVFAYLCIASYAIICDCVCIPVYS